MAITADAGARALLARLVADPKLKAIERIPLVSPVHMALVVGEWAAFLGASAAYLGGALPLGLAMAINAVAVYVAFTTLHDATHRAVSSAGWLNDLLGTLSATLIIPGVTAGVYRVLHLEHHRWVGDPERDPDTPLVHTRWPWLPLALASPELVWAHWWITKLWHQRSPRERLAYFGSLAVYFAVHVAFLVSPYALEFMLLWLIPQKVGVTFTVYCFAHIQHPEGVDWQKAPLQSTAVINTRPRALMYWVLLGQNDHHIHHLLPHVPWHRYRKVWGLAGGALHREPLAERGVVTGFDPHQIAAARVRLDAHVVAAECVADGVKAITFAPRPGTHFPPFEAGAHVDVHLPSGRVRQYSLCNPPTDRDRYQIAVRLDPAGRGGSKEAHAALAPGVELTLGTPRNLFRLHPDTHGAVLVAGGIGLTPLLAMAHTLAGQGTPFQLHLCARTAAQVPFADGLAAVSWAAQVQRHLDRDGRPGFDPAAALGAHAPGRHLYLCGPPGFMAAVRAGAQAAGWPEAAIHSESFGAAPSVGENRPFEVELRRSAQRLEVPAEWTLLDALRRAGVDVPTACLQGVCGRCKTPVLEGQVEHRDAVLSDAERARSLCVCVSRAQGDRLVLDL